MASPSSRITESPTKLIVRFARHLRKGSASSGRRSLHVCGTNAWSGAHSPPDTWLANVQATGGEGAIVGNLVRVCRASEVSQLS